MVIHMYIAPGQGQITPWGQNFFININILSIFPFPARSNALNVGFMMKRDCSICAANTKGADQLGIYCTADLRLCFPIRKTSFLMYGLRQFGHFGKTLFCHGIKLYHFCNM